MSTALSLQGVRSFAFLSDSVLVFSGISTDGRSLPTLIAWIAGVCHRPIFRGTLITFQSGFCLRVRCVCVFCGSGVTRALQCPFLSCLPLGQVRQQASELLKLAELCPVMGHVIRYTSAATEATATALSVSKGDSTVSATCLFKVHSHRMPCRTVPCNAARRLAIPQRTARPV